MRVTIWASKAELGSARAALLGDTAWIKFMALTSLAHQAHAGSEAASYLLQRVRECRRRPESNACWKFVQKLDKVLASDVIV